MQPENDRNKVWISREEYERLRAAEATGPYSQIAKPATAYYAPPQVFVDPHTDHLASDRMAKQQKTAAVILAILLIISLSTAGWSVITGMVAAIFFIFGIVSMADYQRMRKREAFVPLP